MKKISLKSFEIILKSFKALLAWILGNEIISTVSRFMWANNLKVILTAGIISLAIGYLSQSTPVILGAWMSIAIFAMMALYYSEKRVQELEQISEK